VLSHRAGLVAMSGHRLPIFPSRKPVEYVKFAPCTALGFYYIPGTDICMKVALHPLAGIDEPGPARSLVVRSTAPAVVYPR